MPTAISTRPSARRSATSWRCPASAPRPSSSCNAEIEKPLSIDELVKAVQTDAQKLELYTASRLTIDPDTRAERGYLDLLAGRLRLPDALIDHVEATVSAVKTAAAPSVPSVPAGNSPW